MKKIVITLAVTLTLGVLMSSCKKDYICKCTKTYTGNTTTVNTNYSQYTYKDTRTKAESRCNDNNDSGSDIFGDYSVNCQIQ